MSPATEDDLRREEGMYVPRLLGLLGLALSVAVQGWAFTTDQLLKVDILFAGAQPGDERSATATLARCAMDHRLRVALLYATSGEGIGNVAGEEAGPALGFLREEEARRAAAAYDVHRLYFLGAEELGHALRAETVLERWGAEEMLDRLVRIVRLVQPEIVITMSPEPGIEGGQPQAIGRLMTEAYDKAADTRALVAQLDREGLAPWQPKKLYYLCASPGGTKMPTDDISRDLLLPYSKIKARALDFYLSLGGSANLVVRGAAEEFTLAKSVAPMQPNEADLLAGVFAGAGTTPLGLSMRIAPRAATVAQGGSLAVVLTVENQSDKVLQEAWLELILGAEPFPLTLTRDKFPSIGAGETIQVFHQITLPDEVAPGGELPLVGELRALLEGQVAVARTSTTLSVSSPVAIEFKPLPMEASYRAWAAAHGLQHILGPRPVELPAHSGEATTVIVSVDVGTIPPNTSTAIELISPQGWSVTSPKKDYLVRPDSSFEVYFHLIPPPGTPLGAYPIKAEATAGEVNTCEGSIVVTPIAAAEPLQRAVEVDGSLAEWASLSPTPIPHDRICSGEVDGPEDVQGFFWTGYNSSTLYVAVKVVDDVLLSPSPNALHPHRTADSVEIDIDPGGMSEDTISSLKLGIIPQDAAGRCRALRDADARPGWVEAVAPRIQVAAQRTIDGYNVEAAIPAEYLPPITTLGRGVAMGFNILLRDADVPGAEGALSANGTCLAWSAWPAVSTRPHLWGKLVLR